MTLIKMEAPQALQYFDWGIYVDEAVVGFISRDPHRYVLAPDLEGVAWTLDVLTEVFPHDLDLEATYTHKLIIGIEDGYKAAWLVDLHYTPPTKEYRALRLSLLIEKEGE